MFSTSHSVLLVLLVITCFYYYTECDDELMTHFCLNEDSLHMDSSTVHGQEISTTSCTSGTTNSGVHGAGLCCFELLKKPIPAAKIATVKETRFDCIIPGVIVTTKKGLQMCADPEVDWLKRIIESKRKPTA
ncbi:C-C motif chemokine 5-like [Silurus meridionalis]|uniref:C-C motif chemokine 5-like n=1 Tax=Silurus meridionalis TaxID=175797 RepID=UPI001EEBD0D6|nr:C-C motif chemokine 5-like [Silurus meridionalis]